MPNAAVAWFSSSQLPSTLSFQNPAVLMLTPSVRRFPHFRCTLTIWRAALCSYQSHTMEEQSTQLLSHCPAIPPGEGGSLPKLDCSFLTRGFRSKGRLLFPSLGLINNPKETHWVTNGVGGGMTTYNKTVQGWGGVGD